MNTSSPSPSPILNIVNNDKNKKVKNNKLEISNNTNINIKNTNNNISLDEIKSVSAKSSLSGNSSNSFKIQRISVFINKTQTLINVEKYGKEDMKLLSKKRKSNNLNKK